MNEKQRIYFGSQASPVLQSDLLPQDTGTPSTEGGHVQLDGSTGATLIYYNTTAVELAQYCANGFLWGTSDPDGSTDFIITDNGNGFTIEATGALADTNFPLLVPSNNLLTIAATSAPSLNIEQTGSSLSTEPVFPSSTFTDGDDASTPAEVVISFTPVPDGGTWDFDDQYGMGYNDAFNSTNWSLYSGAPSSGSVTYHANDNASGKSEPPWNADNLYFTSSPGAQTIVAITPSADATAGQINFSDGIAGPAAWNYNATLLEVQNALDNAAMPYTVSNTDGGPWTLTSNDNGDFTSSLAAVSDSYEPLRIPVGVEVIALQDGGASSPSATSDNRRTLLRP